MHACLAKPFIDTPVRVLSPFDFSCDVPIRPVPAAATSYPDQIQHQSPAPIAVQELRQVLHIGCGTYHPDKLPDLFREAGWREIRLDIDPQVEPDLVASITDMRIIADSAMTAVYSAHNIEHLYPHEVPAALSEIRRVLKPDGFAYITLPDLQEVAHRIADGKLDEPLYLSTMGPIAPLDIIYGHRGAIADGNMFMAHRTGFTSETLGRALIEAGFAAALVQRQVAAFALTAIAFRHRPGQQEVRTAHAHMSPDWPVVLYEPAH